ncbi:cell division protein ZipA [Microplitis demolitor]|uniref:cell division protein ZipA n=1 Tax=Microplitis demolitor TaxID=69319 RepID=UPI00235B68C3|nr:cell division protein ZipA [Microplitis demolitor]
MLLIIFLVTNVLAHELDNLQWQHHGNYLRNIESNNLAEDPRQNFNYDHNNNGNNFYGGQVNNEFNDQSPRQSNPGNWNFNHNYQSQGPVTVNEHVEITKPLALPVFKYIGVPYQQPVEIPVPHTVAVRVPQPYPVHVPVMQPVGYPVMKTIFVPVEKKVPYEVERIVPVPVEQPVPIAIEKPIPVPVEAPYPIHIPIYKNIYHRKIKGRSSRGRERRYKG